MLVLHSFIRNQIAHVSGFKNELALWVCKHSSDTRVVVLERVCTFKPTAQSAERNAVQISQYGFTNVHLIYIYKS